MKSAIFFFIFSTLYVVVGNENEMNYFDIEVPIDSNGDRSLNEINGGQHSTDDSVSNQDIEKNTEFLDILKENFQFLSYTLNWTG